MKKWKTVRNVTMTILIVFLLLILMLGLGFLMDNATYPEAVYGLTRFEAFDKAAGFIVIILGIPILINIVLFVISLISHDPRLSRGLDLALEGLFTDVCP